MLIGVIPELTYRGQDACTRVIYLALQTHNRSNIAKMKNSFFFTFVCK